MWSLFKRSDERFKQLHDVLRKSFSAVRQDTQNLQRWLDYLNRRNQYQEQLIGQQNQRITEQAEIIKELTEELEQMPTSPQDIRDIVDAYYGIEPFKEKLVAMDRKVDALAHRLTVQQQVPAQQPQIQPQVPTQVHQDIQHLHSKVEQLSNQKSNMRDRLVKRITKNSREYVKGVILSYIKKMGEISALRLKEMIVDEQFLCSKSSFYRMMEDIEKHHDVNTMRKGREKHYMAKLSSTH